VCEDVWLFSGPHGVKTVAVRPWTLVECSKRALYMFTCQSCSSHTTPSTSKDTATISKMGHMIVVGLPMLRVRRRNLQVGSEPPRETRVRDKATQRLTSSWRIHSPIKETWHPQVSYLSPDQEVSFMPLHVFPPGITQERGLKPPSPDLTMGIGPYLVLWRGICPGLLSPANGDLGSTQILT
jgi:hypothetical protein